MMRSLYSGVAGLKAHQTKMDVIGNNISNVNTYGFKASRTTFRDVYYQTLSSSSNASGNMGGKNPSQVGYGASVGSVDVLNSRSGFASTGRGMDCYIDGEGYFVIRDGAGNERLTQVGQLGFDSDGNLIDGNKNFVCGYKVSDSTEKASVGGATIDFGVANKTILDGYTIEVKYGTAGSKPAVSANSASKHITVTVPSDDATAANVKKALLGDSVASPPIPGLADTGAWADATVPTGITATSLTGVTGVTVTGTGTIAETTGKAAEVPIFDTSAPTKITNTKSLDSIAIGADGSITGEDASGKIVTIGQVCIANVANPDGLTQEGSSYYKAVNNTGDITYHAPGDGTVGALETNGLETSNVDLATELSDMIIAQRGFQANSKIITVADEMLDELVSMKR